jgi:hypothetical protein
MAPNYAHLYVKQYSILSKKYLLPNIIIWKRFIYGISVLWRGDAKQLQAFQAFLNSYSGHLRFTMQSRTRQIRVLDLLIM